MPGRYGEHLPHLHPVRYISWDISRIVLDSYLHFGNKLFVSLKLIFYMVKMLVHLPGAGEKNEK